MPKADLINNTYRVKLTNKTLIKNALKSMGTATRTEVSQKTGLSIATCRNILNELVRDGEVLEDALEATNTVGRPARRYSFNKDFSYVAGINMNIDGEERTLQYVVANLDGEIIADEHEQRETVTSDDLVHLTDTLMEKWPSITALALGIPGTFSKDGEIFACDFTDLNGTNIKEAILAGFKAGQLTDQSLGAFSFIEKDTLPLHAFAPGDRVRIASWREGTTILSQFTALDDPACVFGIMSMTWK